MKTKQRDSNIELMRILCILMVIAGHYYYHGGWENGLSPTNEVFLKVFGGGSKLAVNCFVLITGYFGANIQTKRVIPLIRDRWFYSVFLTTVLVTFGICSLNAKLLIKTVFPLFMCRHNYITVFVMLYFFIPFINKAISKLSKRDYEKFLIVSVFFISILPSIYPTFGNNTYSYLSWMILLYCIGRYLGTYKPKLPWNWIFIISISVLLLLTLCIEPRLSFYPENYAIGTQYSFPLLVASTSMLGIFSQLKITKNKIINGLAKSTFAVYILHDDPNVRSYIWKNFFHNSEFGQSGYLWIHFFCTVLFIYLVCILIDKLYKSTIFKILTKIPTKKVGELIDKICLVDN